MTQPERYRWQLVAGVAFIGSLMAVAVLVAGVQVFGLGRVEPKWGTWGSLQTALCADLLICLEGVFGLAVAIWWSGEPIGSHTAVGYASRAAIVFVALAILWLGVVSILEPLGDGCRDGLAFLNIWVTFFVFGATSGIVSTTLLRKR